MLLNEYQEQTATSAVYPGKGSILGLLYTGLGLGEAGEIQGKIKKIVRDDNFIMTPEKRVQIIKELGDLMWYISQTATELDTTLEEVAKINIDKLQGRRERGTIQGSGDDR